MKTIAVSINTMREVIRDKVLLIILVLGLISIMSVKLIAPLSFGEEVRLIKDFGLSMISIIGILITVFVSTRLVFDEVQRKTIYMIIPKSVKRWQFIVGKYLGIIFALSLIIGILGFIFILYLIVFKVAFSTNIIVAIFLQFMEIIIVSAVAILFSTFSSPMSSGVFTFAIYFCGHFTADILVLGELTKSPILKNISTALYYILPNLSYFNVRAAIANNLSLDLNATIFAVAYGLAYTIILLSLAIVIFERKDL